jgi:general secretion pathway protein E
MSAVLKPERLDIDTLYRIVPRFDTVAYTACTAQRLLYGEFNDSAILAISDQAPASVWDWLQGRLEGSEQVVFVADDDLSAVLDRHAAGIKALSTEPVQASGTEDAGFERLSLEKLQGESNPVVRILGSTLFDAYRSLASDIHIESTRTGLEIKYRLDGVLAKVASIDDKTTAEQLVSRLKVLAHLDVGERRVPQDGRFRIGLDRNEVDLRVSIIPSIHGEDAVLRLLDRRALSSESEQLTLDRLGLSESVMASIRELSGRPHGMLLMTGPTGSGKTTTLYAALSEINDGRQKIITIEDPVEYQLRGVLQVPVNDRTGLTFARGLRAILRHDPDVILVGEIRDEETAQIAVQAALTGHLVFSSIHANGAIDVIGRFGHMGVDPYNLTSALNGVIAQRLLRLNCPRCAERKTLSHEQRARFPALRNVDSTFQGRGCGECRGTGYRGRRAVAEILLLDDDLREGIVRREPPRVLRQLAQHKGMSRMAEQAALLVGQGQLSFEEFRRVAEMD